MADSVVRLKVESQEYDQKLKRAQEGLTRYADECRKVGGTLEVVEKDTLDYVKALGQMDTVSRTATGQLAEMKKTFTELSVVYKNMSEQEKQSPFGQALSSSLDQLKVRINDSKAQLDDISKSLNGGGGLSGALDSIAGKFGVNISQLTKFGSVVGVTTTALQVSKDAFFQSESGIDEWGRTVEGAKGAYNIFLDTLNNGNWSNFFENLQTAIKGGRELYDVFDRLGSIKSNNAAAIAIVQQQIAQLRLAKQQGENVDAQLKDATARLAQLQKQSITAGKAAGSKSAFEVIRNGVNSVGGNGVNDATIKYVIDQIMKNGQSEFDKYKYNYQTLRNRGMVTKTQTISDSQGGTYERQYKEFDINALTKEQQKQYSLAKTITEGETRIQKGIAAYAQSVQEGTASAREEFKGNRYALQGSDGRGGSGGSKTTPEYIPLGGSIDEQAKKVQELQKAWRAAADDDSRKRIKEQIEQAQLVLDVISGKTDVKDVEIRVNSEEALKDVEKIEGVTIQPKSFTVTVDDDKAADELKKLGAVQIDDKTFSITANDDNVLKNIKAIEGVTIGDKSFMVTVDDDKAADELKKLGAVQIDDKTFSITANDDNVLKNIRAIEGVTIGDKSFMVTVDDAKAADELKKLGAVQIGDKTFSITANDEGVLKNIRAIEGVTIGDKSFMVTVDDAKAADELKKLGAVQIGDKTFSITANDEDVLKNIKAIEGVKIDPKSFKVTALTADALAALQKVNDVVIADKTFKIEPVVGQMPSVAMENPFERAKGGLQEIRQKVRLEIDKENLKADTDTLQTILKDAMQQGINTGGILDFQFIALGDEIAKGINVPDDVWQGILDQYNELREQIGGEPIKIDFKTGSIAKEGKEVSKEWSSAANAISSVGSAMQSIEDPSAKIVGTIAQAIATIALTYAQSLKGSFTVWDWIAGAASGMATMMSVVSAIHSTTGYAQGGIVKGNSYSGDNIPAMVGGSSGELVGLNAGEVVLTKAMAGNLASQLEGNSGGGRYIPSHVSGEQIWIALNAYTKRSGKGELVTWR
jgi:sorbitol-specific phosphotransferase system component IIA